ncbi:uncharacterized protein LOC111134979 isoform X2 [Crassostrea virginica]
MSRTRVIVLLLCAITTLGILLTAILKSVHNKKNSSSAAPVTASDSAARWTNPCNATRNFSAGDFAIWDVPEFEKIQRIQENLLATKDKAASLKTKLAKERLRSIALELSLESKHIDNFPNTTLSQEDLELYKTNVTLAYVRSYRDLSVVAVFLEAIREDEVKYEHGSLLSVFHENEEQLYRLLCEVHNAILVSGVTIGYESRDIMPNNMRNMSDRFWRNMRDFIIIKDSVTLFQSILNMTQAVLESRNSSS